MTDVRFRMMITPRLISWLYVLMIACVLLWTGMGLLMIWSLAEWMGAGMWWFAPLVVAAGVVGLIMARVSCEWTFMAFTRGLAPREYPDDDGYGPGAALGV